MRMDAWHDRIVSIPILEGCLDQGNAVAVRTLRVILKIVVVKTHLPNAPPAQLGLR